MPQRSEQFFFVILFLRWHNFLNTKSDQVWNSWNTKINVLTHSRVIGQNIRAFSVQSRFFWRGNNKYCCNYLTYRL